MNNVIYKYEDTYGFLDDLVLDLQNNVELARDNGDDENAELLEKAIKDANELLEDCDNYNYIFKLWYNPMGAFAFTKLVEEQ